jgi:heme exporter protein C
MFIHVPAAWLGLFVYLCLGGASFLSLVFRQALADAAARAAAPLGAVFTGLALATGSLWGKPMWGTWWVWDARLTSELILFFLYLGYIALTSAIDDVRRADRAGALIAIVGAINVPIIYFSVKWWNTLHQGASVSLTRSPSMAQLMLWGMLLMALAMWVYTLAIVCYRVRTLIIERERHTDWVQALPEVAGAKA